MKYLSPIILRHYLKTRVLFYLSLFEKTNFYQWFNSLVSYVNKAMLVTTQCSYNHSDLSFSHDLS